MGLKIWNSIPKSIQKLLNHIFKRKVRALLLEVLKSQDTYADLTTIISEMKRL